jgi:streptomycin 3"-adenylyltransferase
VTGVLGRSLVAAYLYGSALAGGLRPASDLDVLVITRRQTSPAQRRLLIDGLRPLSYRGERPATWRPVELTVVARPDVDPWRYPPRLDFQSGEWLRSAFDSGDARPWRSPNPDLAVVLAQVRRASRALSGRAATELLPEVPTADLRRAMTDELPSLLDDLSTDTANVLLTLARMWFTLATGDFAPKDEAADWAIARLSPGESSALERARDTYRAGTYESWAVPIDAAGVTAGALLRSIERIGEPR